MKLQFPTIGQMDGCSDCASVLEPQFSAEPCDLCETNVFGQRLAAHGLDPGEGTIHLRICQSCRDIHDGIIKEQSMSQIFVVIKTQSPVMEQGKQVAVHTKEDTKVFDGDTPVEDIREWALARNAATCTLFFETK